MNILPSAFLLARDVMGECSMHEFVALRLKTQGTCGGYQDDAASPPPLWEI